MENVIDLGNINTTLVWVKYTKHSLLNLLILSLDGNKSRCPHWIKYKFKCLNKYRILCLIFKPVKITIVGINIIYKIILISIIIMKIILI